MSGMYGNVTLLAEFFSNTVVPLWYHCGKSLVMHLLHRTALPKEHICEVCSSVNFRSELSIMFPFLMGTNPGLINYVSILVIISIYSFELVL